MSENVRKKITDEKFYISNIPKDKLEFSRLVRFLGDGENWEDFQLALWVNTPSNNFVFYFEEMKEYTFFIGEPNIKVDTSNLITIDYYDLMKQYLPKDFPFEIGETVTNIENGSEVIVRGYGFYVGEVDYYILVFNEDTRAEYGLSATLLLNKPKGEVRMDRITKDTPVGTKVAHRNGESEYIIEEVNSTKYKYLAIRFKGILGYFRADDYSIIDEAIKCPDFRTVKVGDTVYCPRRGKGEVTFVKEQNVTPITVTFKLPDETCIKRSYTFQGKLREKDLYPSLFWQPFTIPDEAYVRPLPKMEVDTLIWVWGDNKATKRLRFFKCFANDGRVKAFDSGYNSESTTLVTTWDNWELYEPKVNK